MNHLISSIKNLGLFQGLSIYWKLKDKDIKSISMDHFADDIHLRPGTTDKSIFKQIFLKQDLNLPVFDALEPEKILDLGANIGLSSLYLTQRFPHAQIISVEPVVENCLMFKKNLENFKNVSLIQAAIRGDNTKVSIKDLGSGESGYMVEENELGLPAITIPDIMKLHQWERIDILKMDVEGSEKSVFEGYCDSWLPKTKVLLVELHDRKIRGCKKALSKALDPYDFEQSTSGEYLVLINKNTY